MFRNFPLNAVKLTEGDFAARQLLVKNYIKEFDLDRLLHTFRIHAGLESNAEPLEGWEAPTCGLRGHFVGHFLSACVKFAYADEDEALREKAFVIIDTFKACIREDGYLSAFPDTVLDELEKEEDRGVWAPYYTFHKIMQGLVDAYTLLHSEDALCIALRFAHYMKKRIDRPSFWTIDGMLRCTKVNPKNEFGGIGEVLYQLYAVSKDEEVLALAKVFDRDYFIGYLAQDTDILEDLHSNTHLPMILAAVRRYNITGEEKYRTAAENFYKFLKGRTFANGNSSSKARHYIKGGVSEASEHWARYGDLSDALTGGESESCCAHNTEKLAEFFFNWTGDVRYLDHIERLKYNGVLNSASSRTGLSQYHQPMGVRRKKRFSGLLDAFWCCTGSGVEAMSELQKNIWFADGDKLLINLFIPSKLCWEEKGLTIEQCTAYPDGEKITYRVSAKAPVPVTLSWKADRLESLTVNGNAAALSAENGFDTLCCTLKDGDLLEAFVCPKLHFEALPGTDDCFAVLKDHVLMATTAEDETLPESGAALGDSWLPLYRVEEETYSVYLSKNITAKEAAAEVKDGSHAYEP